MNQILKAKPNIVIKLYEKKPYISRGQLEF